MSGKFAKTSCRLYKVRCIGNSDQVADMLEDIAKKVRKGAIHCADDMFYNMESMGYVKEDCRGEWHDKDRKRVQ